MRSAYLLLVGLVVVFMLSALLDRGRAIFAAPAENRGVVQYDHTGQKVYWEKIIEETSHHFIYRTYVPGGWLVIFTFGKTGSSLGSNGSIVFYPDQTHEWQPAVEPGAPWAAK